MKELWSIFGDINKCMITGMSTGIERHHIFSRGKYKKGKWDIKDKSEDFGFIAPLHKTLHPNGVHLQNKNWCDLDHYLRRRCQEYFLENIGTREDWLDIYGRFYDDRDDEGVWLNNAEMGNR